jgi:hypothetical protein
MAFLAGPPDYGRGAVLRRPRPQQQPDQARLMGASPVAFEGSFGDINPYSYAPVSQATERAPAAAPAPPVHQNGNAEAQVEHARFPILTPYCLAASQQPTMPLCTHPTFCMQLCTAPIGLYQNS